MRGAVAPRATMRDASDLPDAMPNEAATLSCFIRG